MPTRNLKCPKCATVVVVPEGQKPMCSNCGFGAESAPAAPQAPAAQGFAAPSFAAPAYQAPQQGYAQQPGFAPQGGPPARPGAVTFVGVLEYIYAGLIGLVGLLFLLGGLFFGSLIAAVVSDYGGDGAAGDLAGGVIMAVGLVVGLLAIGFAVLLFFVARGILKGRAWARIVGLVLGILGILGGLGSLRNPSGGIIGLALDIAIVVILFLPATTQWFKQMASYHAATGR